MHSIPTADYTGQANAVSVYERILRPVSVDLDDNLACDVALAYAGFPNVDAYDRDIARCAALLWRRKIRHVVSGGLVS